MHGWLRTESGAEKPPVRVWRDWVLAAVVVGSALLEVMVRDDMVWRPVALAFGLTLALSMLWRRTQPLAMVGLAFGGPIALDLASVIFAGGPFSAYAGSFVLVLVYSLFRWGTTRQAVLGLVIVLVEAFLAITIDFTGLVDAVGGLFVLLFPAAVGVSIRYRHLVDAQRFETARSREREMLARELHDTVAHHVSAIAIQAQAGRFLAGTHDLAGAAKSLEVIETESSRALVEMRSVVGSLRRDNQLAPESAQRGVADIRLWPRPTEGTAYGSRWSSAATWTTCAPLSSPRCTGWPRSRSPTRIVTRGRRARSTSSSRATTRGCG